MSDTPNGTDWWLASDGKWYPPSSTPAWSPPGHPPPSRSLSRWLQGAWWSTAVLGAATAATAWTARDAASVWADDPTLRHALDWEDLDVGAVGALNLLSIALLVALILTIVWMYGTHKHQGSLEPGHRSWGAAWAIVGWFIPVGHLFIPKLVLQEIERIARRPRHPDGTVDLDAPRTRLAGAGHLFWLGWIVGITAIGASTVVWDGQLEVTALEQLDPSAVLDAYAWRTVGGLALVVAGVAGALHLRRLHRMVTTPA